MHGRRLTQEEFVARGSEIHDGRYTYPEPYRGMALEITITCPKHGNFICLTDKHLKGAGCPSCRWVRQAATSQGVSLADYLKARDEGKRYCKVHGLQDLKAYQSSKPKGSTRIDYRCKECRKVRGFRDRKKNNAYQNRVNKRIRLEVLNHYSPGKLCCAICGEDHQEFLCIDHINGGGKKHRESIKGAYWSSFKRKGWPEGFRVLCYNCNLKYGCRDHFWKGTGVRVATDEESLAKLTPRKRASVIFRVKNPERFKELVRKTQLKIKADVMAHYGGSCVCCGIDDLEVLSIDHIGSTGAAHRKELKSKGEYFGYAWIKKNGYPSGLRVLCVNCNFALGFYGYCPHDKDKVRKPPPQVDLEYLRAADNTTEAQAALVRGHKREEAVKFLPVHEALRNRGKETLALMAERLGVSIRTLIRIRDGEHWSCQFVESTGVITT